ncbi:MAG TPA: CBS domain-containing protein [Candidatus Saccharimonadales bacterium]
MFILFILIDILLWLLLVALRSIRLRHTELSEYELNRRLKAKDVAIEAIMAREHALPDIKALKYLLETILLVVLIVIVAAQFGALAAIIAMVSVLLGLAGMSRWKFLAERVEYLFLKYEPHIIHFVNRWHGSLQWFYGDAKPRVGQFVYSKEELIDQLKTTHGVITAHELALIASGLQFGSKLVGDVMTPRSVIDLTYQTDTLGPVVLNRLHASGHSRFPVVEGDIDHVVGMLYMRDLIPLKKDYRTVKDAMRPDVFYIREDQDLEHALAAFIRTHHHLFVVVNEYRETVGLLALEDVLESLLGRKIIDEFDKHDDLRAVAAHNPRHNNLPPKRKDV